MKAALFLSLGVMAFFSHPARADMLEDYLLRSAIIHDSIAQYPGVCACPYSVDSRGNECGARSAWSRPGGRSVLCYRSDITDGMVGLYRDNLLKSLLQRY